MNNTDKERTQFPAHEDLQECKGTYNTPVHQICKKGEANAAQSEENYSYKEKCYSGSNHSIADFLVAIPTQSHRQNLLNATPDN